MAYKWFKHWNEAHEGQTIGQMYADRDYESVSYFWLILELISKYENPDAPGYLVLKKTFLARKMNMKMCRLLNLHSRFVQFAREWKINSTEEEIEFLVPKWSELQERRGGKRESKKTQNGGRSKKEEVRSKSAQQILAVCLPEFEPIKEILLDRKVMLDVQRQWAETYKEPAWLIEQVRKAVAWELSNPKRKKKNFSAFMNNWLSRGWESKTSQNVFRLEPAKIKSVDEVLAEIKNAKRDS